MADSMSILDSASALTLPEFQRFINLGAFGKVYLGKCDNGELVAVKEILLNENTNWQNLNQELQISKHLKHPYIVHTHEILYSDNAVYVIQEYCERGDLFEVITPLEGIADEHKIKKYFRQLVDATAYMHGEGLVHRDIKPENVALTADDNIRLIDFGLSGPVEEEVEPCVGTVPYMAPEVYRGVRGEKHDAKASDVFSLGIVLHVMICGFYPWDSPSQHEPAFANFVKNGHSFGKPWAPALNAIFVACLHIIPKKRTTAAELLSTLQDDHAWKLAGEREISYPPAISYTLAPEIESQLQRPKQHSRGLDVDIVFTEDARSPSHGSTEEDFQYSMPEKFNPLVDIPRRRTRLVSECDNGLEIHFDSEMENSHLLTTINRPSSLSEVDDDEYIPRWSWRASENPDDDDDDDGDDGDDGISQTKNERKAWADIDHEMSFATLPEFDDFALKQPCHSETESSKVINAAAERVDEVKSAVKKWGDMSWDMSYSNISHLVEGASETGPAHETLQDGEVVSKGRCLFTVGEDDNETSDEEGNTEEGHEEEKEESEMSGDDEGRPKGEADSEVKDNSDQSTDTSKWHSHANGSADNGTDHSDNFGSGAGPFWVENGADNWLPGGADESTVAAEGDGADDDTQSLSNWERPVICDKSQRGDGQWHCKTEENKPSTGFAGYRAHSSFSAVCLPTWPAALSKTEERERERGGEGSKPIPAAFNFAHNAVSQDGNATVPSDMSNRVPATPQRRARTSTVRRCRTDVGGLSSHGHETGRNFGLRVCSDAMPGVGVRSKTTGSELGQTVNTATTGLCVACGMAGLAQLPLCRKLLSLAMLDFNRVWGK